MATETPAIPLLANAATSPTDPEKGPTSQTRQNPWWLPKPLDDPRVWRPLSIASGPLPVISFIWIFYGFTSKKPLPLPDYFVPIVRAHSQSATMVVSIVATIIAAYISFFFSLAVRYVITILLATRSTSLDVLSSVTRIAQKSLWLHDLRVKWTWIVLFAYIGINLQTSSLTSFLSIREIRVRQNLNGHDIDITSTRVLQEGQLGIPAAYGELTSAFLQSIMISSLQFERNISSTFNFNGYTYLSTTGGVQPASFLPTHVEHLTNKTNLTAPPNLQDISKNKHTMLPFNKTMVLAQQGLTADVDCRVGDPRASTVYQASLEELGTSMNLTLVDLAITCPGAGRTSRLSPVVYEAGNPNIGAVLANGCQIPNTNSWDVIFRTTGPYLALNGTICTVTPKVTIVNVTYTNPQDPQSLTTLSVTKPIQTSRGDVPVWGALALQMLLFNTILGQSTIGSAIGNAWLLTPGAQEQVSLAGAMNTYIRAAVEFFGTVVRQLYSQPDSIFFTGGWDSISDSMRTPIIGTFTATTYGWYQERQVSPLFLLPTTLTIIATYAILAYGVALAIKHKDHFLEEDADFDPTNIVHIIAAHTPETRRSDFRTFSDRPTGYIKNIWVKLKHREGIRAFDVSTRQGEGGAADEEQSSVRDSQSAGARDLKSEIK